MTDDDVRGGDSMGAVVRNVVTGEKKTAVDLSRHFDALLAQGRINPEVARHVEQLRHLARETMKDRAKLAAQAKTLRDRDVPRLEEQLEARDAAIANLRSQVEDLSNENIALAAGQGTKTETEDGD